MSIDAIEFLFPASWEEEKQKSHDRVNTMLRNVAQRTASPEQLQTISARAAIDEPSDTIAPPPVDVQPESTPTIESLRDKINARNSRKS